MKPARSSLNHLKRLRLLADTYHLTRLYRVRGDVHNLAVNHDVTVADQLARSRTGRSNAKTEHYIVQTALKVLEKNLTGNAVSLGCLLKHITELTLKYTVCVFSLLLLCQHDTVLGHLPATVVAMLSRREVPSGQNFVRAKYGLSKTARDFRFRSYISSHNILIAFLSSAYTITMRSQMFVCVLELNSSPLRRTASVVR